jgi:hypothetical protein
MSDGSTLGGTRVLGQLAAFPVAEEFARDVERTPLLRRGVKI